ncbi:hypothetical protein D9M73_269780 [compost metagenome]
MQQHRIVAGFSNRQMKTCISSALLGPIHFTRAGVTILQGIERCLEALTIRLSRADCRVIGARCLQGMPEFQQIALGLRITLQ